VANAVVYVWFVKKVASGVAVFSFKRRERENQMQKRERERNGAVKLRKISFLKMI
jgi:hypothetical protein